MNGFSTPPPDNRHATKNDAKHNVTTGFSLADCLVKSNSDTNLEEATDPGKQGHYEIIPVPLQLPNPRDANKFCAYIENVLSPTECQNLIQRSTEAGYSAALFKNTLDVQSRNSDRCIIDDPHFANILFERIKHCLPPQRTNRMGVKWELDGLNERIRILRYNEGNYFAPHYDGWYCRNRKERSFYTLMLYLNTGGGVDFKGGSTNFISDDDEEESDSDTGSMWSSIRSSFYGKKKRQECALTKFVPKVGSVLVFDHSTFHEGAKLEGGVKYAVRTDVMFRDNSGTSSTACS
jgi:prolyl 4-hydroxylase